MCLISLNDWRLLEQLQNVSIDTFKTKINTPHQLSSGSLENAA